MNNDFELQSDDNNWTDKKVKTLLEWQQQSRIYNAGHARSEELFAHMNNTLLIPSMIIGAVATLCAGMSLLWPDAHKPFIIIALLLTAIITIFNGILQIMKPESQAADHADMSKGYSRLILEIEETLAKEPFERADGRLFLSKIKDELTALKTGGVKIPLKVWNEIKNGYLRGELGFQKMSNAHRDSFPDKISIKNADTKTPINTSANNMDLSSDTIINVVDTSNEKSLSLPRFELIIDNDPVSKKIQDRLFEFHLNRFS